jgi:hypothetical protein
MGRVIKKFNVFNMVARVKYTEWVLTFRSLGDEEKKENHEEEFHAHCCSLTQRE